MGLLVVGTLPLVALLAKVSMTSLNGKRYDWGRRCSCRWCYLCYYSYLTLTCSALSYLGMLQWETRAFMYQVSDYRTVSRKVSTKENHARREAKLMMPSFGHTGAGFSGFWYHLGLFQAMTKETMYEYDYYCYSSACLSLILGFLQTPVEDAYHTCQAIQQEWYRGELSTHNMVDEFLRRLVVPFLEGDDNNQQMTSRPRPPASWLSRIHIMSTNLATGVEIQQATNRDELVQLIKQTTWIPFLTGQDWRLLLDNGEHNNSNTFMAAGYLDGYFSIPLHPPCRYTARVPFSPGMYLHSLNPALGQNQVFEFVRYGQGQVNNPFELNNRWNTTTG